ncbi:uncharacterized protein LOC106056459 isoform X1 [Biomphalaria glabrata]|uniref:Uncharacterized protein LOC106056459 isoform X1 n=1 Tax=Biomphalaria glabrata TaxID=6526 RepID=A0A9W3APR2_BIOGL|nr:uncharacterized protein LOC106056459 isoform X1 [Biomphalaria glabrata]
MLAGAVGWSCSRVANLLLVFLLQFPGPLTLVASGVIRICFDGNEDHNLGQVKIQCGEDDVIDIEEALLVRNKWGRCLFMDGDCVEKTRIFNSCNGQTICNKSYKVYSAKCGYSTMMTLLYSCRPALSLLSTTSTPAPSVKSSRESAPTSVSRLNVLNIVQNSSSERPSVYTVAPEVKGKNEHDGKEFKETAIIVGCVIASVVTVIALFVAIVLVVKRLLQKKNSRVEDSHSEKDCTETTCINLDVPCFTPGATREQAERDIKTAKRTINKASSFRTFTGKTKTRMAPVGEESVTDQVTVHCENNLPSSPQSSARMVSWSSTSHPTSDNIDKDLTGSFVDCPAILQTEVHIRRSLKRDAKNNNIGQKLNENLKSKSKSKNNLKTTDDFTSLAAKNEEAASPRLNQKSCRI